jgi:tRNA (guanine-N7-)-methyltransferase
MKRESSLINPYVDLMYGEFKSWSFDENARENKGLWRSQVFKVGLDIPLDLEIGTGNGTHFAQLAQNFPDRLFVGLELKYKTLVQSIRRALQGGSKNARMAKFPAESIKEIFSPNEVNNVYIHFPDPWPKKRHHKNRLIQKQFLIELYSVMKDQSFLEFKTDDLDYFKWALVYFNQSPFELIFYTEDLHNSFRRDKNFVTHFESLFLKRNEPIYCCLLKKIT